MQCGWCQATFPARTVGGHVKRYCSADCKNAFHGAARRLAEREIDAGRLTIDDLRGHTGVVHDE